MTVKLVVTPVDDPPVLLAGFPSTFAVGKVAAKAGDFYILAKRATMGSGDPVALAAIDLDGLWLPSQGGWVSILSEGKDPWTDDPGASLQGPVPEELLQWLKAAAAGTIDSVAFDRLIEPLLVSTEESDGPGDWTDDPGESQPWTDDPGEAEAWTDDPGDGE